ncbi:peptide chain release factor family protein [Sporobolomyces koalae]|uniref:peptide chain release factor family protein n=1 Tax=Sporobolomyces koalae TaxID=500713 RepID=UPI00317AACDA
MLSRLASSVRCSVSPASWRAPSIARELSTSHSTWSASTPPPATLAPKKRTPPKPRAKKVLPDLIEADLLETFVRGSGPGGQATNKTSNAASIVHVPTGIRVLCHETRSRETNRKLARRILQDRLDQLESAPGESRRDQEALRARRKKEAKRRKGRRKADSAPSTEDDSLMPNNQDT